jgi:hypothetical protein
MRLPHCAVAAATLHRTRKSLNDKLNAIFYIPAKVLLIRHRVAKEFGMPREDTLHRKISVHFYFTSKKVKATHLCCDIVKQFCLC